MPIVAGIVGNQRSGQCQGGRRNPCIGRPHLPTLPHALVPNLGPSCTKHAVRMQNGEVVQVSPQQAALPLAPVGVQGALAHLSDSHEADHQLKPAHDVYISRSEYGVPIENKAGNVRIDGESLSCLRRTGQYGAAHRCGVRRLQTPPPAPDRCDLEADRDRTGRSGSDWADA